MMSLNITNLVMGGKKKKGKKKNKNLWYGQYFYKNNWIKYHDSYIKDYDPSKVYNEMVKTNLPIRIICFDTNKEWLQNKKYKNIEYDIEVNNSTYGEGLFAKREFNRGDLVFQDYNDNWWEANEKGCNFIFKYIIKMINDFNISQIELDKNLSRAWHLVGRWLNEGPPKFAESLTINYYFVNQKFFIKENRILFEILKKQFPKKNIYDIFGKCITNFMFGPGLSKCINKTNHSKDPNIVVFVANNVYDTNEFMLTDDNKIKAIGNNSGKTRNKVIAFAKKNIKLGEEIVFNYGTSDIFDNIQKLSNVDYQFILEEYSRTKEYDKVISILKEWNYNNIDKIEKSDKNNCVSCIKKDESISWNIPESMQIDNFIKKINSFI